MSETFVLSGYLRVCKELTFSLAQLDCCLNHFLKIYIAIDELLYTRCHLLVTHFAQEMRDDLVKLQLMYSRYSTIKVLIDLYCELRFVSFA